MNTFSICQYDNTDLDSCIVPRPDGHKWHLLGWVSFQGISCIETLLITLARSSLPNVVPASDCAGEITAVGGDVKDWQVGQRVCANFSPDHVYGAVTYASRDSALGAQDHGVLTQYRAFPSHVRSIASCKFRNLIERCFNSRSLKFPGISRMKKHPLSRMCLIEIK